MHAGLIVWHVKYADEKEKCGWKADVRDADSHCDKNLQGKEATLLA